MSRSDIDRLWDILEAIERVRRYTDAGRDPFDANELVRVWVLYHLQIIGEAAARLSSELRSQYDQIPWSKMIGMRNILIHGYFGIDEDVVWLAVERDLEALEAEIRTIVEQAES